MIGTKALYGSTLLLAGLAGFSTGWTARPAEVRFASFTERRLHEYETHWRIGAAEREELRAILAEFEKEIEGLRREFDRNFEGQVTAVKDRFDRRIEAILVPAKRR